MKAPSYSPDVAGLAGTCSLCGCTVADKDVHTSWHAALARLLGLEDDE